MGQPKRRNDLNLSIGELDRLIGRFQQLMEGTVDDRGTLDEINDELAKIRLNIKGLDAQNKALFKLFGVIYKILTEPEKSHDKFELFDDSKSTDAQSGSIHDHPA